MRDIYRWLISTELYRNHRNRCISFSRSKSDAYSRCCE